MGLGFGEEWKRSSEDEVAIAQPLPRRAEPGDRPSFEHESEDEYEAAIESTRELSNPFVLPLAHVLAVKP